MRWRKLRCSRTQQVGLLLLLVAATAAVLAVLAEEGSHSNFFFFTRSSKDQSEQLLSSQRRRRQPVVHVDAYVIHQTRFPLRHRNGTYFAHAKSIAQVLYDGQNYVAVGAPYDDDGRGAVYVWVRGEDTGWEWANGDVYSIITVENSLPEDLCGSSIAIGVSYLNGPVADLSIGCPGVNGSGIRASGAAIPALTTPGYVRVARDEGVQGTVLDEGIGKMVATTPDFSWLAVAPERLVSNTVRIYRRTGDTWSTLPSVSLDLPDTRFGHLISFDDTGSTLVVSISSDTVEQGLGFVAFSFDAMSNSFVQDAIVWSGCNPVAPYAQPQVYDMEYAGSYVVVSCNRGIVSAGKIYIFYQSGGTWSASNVHVIEADDYLDIALTRYGYFEFGRDVAIAVDSLSNQPMIAVGAREAYNAAGAVLLFKERNAGYGSGWDLVAELQSTGTSLALDQKPKRNALYGSAVSLTSAGLVVGAQWCFHGERCMGELFDVSVDHCTDPFPCTFPSRGDCVSSLVSYKCFCFAGYSGSNCEIVTSSVEILDSSGAFRMGVSSIRSDVGVALQRVPNKFLTGVGSGGHLYVRSRAVVASDFIIGDAGEAFSVRQRLDSLQNDISAMEAANTFSLSTIASRDSGYVHDYYEFDLFLFSDAVEFNQGLNVSVYESTDGGTTWTIAQSWPVWHTPFDRRVAFVGSAFGDLNPASLFYYHIEPDNFTSFDGKKLMGWNAPNGAENNEFQIFQLRSRVFVTSVTVRPGVDFTSKAGADGICDSLADSEGLTAGSVSTFEAILSTSKRSARDYLDFVETGLRAFFPYLVSFSGEGVASSRVDLFGNLVNAIELDEAGNAPLTDFLVWTGSDESGHISETCNDWGSSDATLNGRVGDLRRYDGGVWSNSTRPCSEDHHLYCVEVFNDEYYG